MVARPTQLSIAIRERSTDGDTRRRTKIISPLGLGAFSQIFIFGTDMLRIGFIAELPAALSDNMVNAILCVLRNYSVPIEKYLKETLK